MQEEKPHKTTGKGVCSRLAARRGIHNPYSKGLKYYSHCESFLQTDESRCSCCNKVLRDASGDQGYSILAYQVWRAANCSGSMQVSQYFSMTIIPSPWNSASFVASDIDYLCATIGIAGIRSEDCCSTFKVHE